MENSVISSIRNEIARKEKGTVFLSKDLSALGSTDAVKKALSRLCSAGLVTRLGRGLYYVPKKDDIFGFGVLLPSTDQIAHALADSEGISIIPTTDFAMNALNLTTQMQTNSVYLTDGCRRHIALEGYKGNGITFIHSSNKRLFKIQNRWMLLIILSMIGIGENNINEAQLHLIKSHLVNISLQDYLQDIKLAPLWIQKKLVS